MTTDLQTSPATAAPSCPHIECARGGRIYVTAAELPEFIAASLEDAAEILIALQNPLTAVSIPAMANIALSRVHEAMAAHDYLKKKYKTY